MTAKIQIILAVILVLAVLSACAGPRQFSPPQAYYHPGRVFMHGPGDTWIDSRGYWHMDDDEEGYWYPGPGRSWRELQ